MTVTPLPPEFRGQKWFVLTCDAVFSGLVILEWVHVDNKSKYPSLYPTEAECFDPKLDDEDSEMCPLECWVDHEGYLTTTLGYIWDGNPEGSLTSA